MAGGGTLPPIAGRTLRFTAAGTQISAATTASDGKAVCWYVPATAGTFAVLSVFDGDAVYRAGSAAGSLVVAVP